MDFHWIGVLLDFAPRHSLIWSRPRVRPIVLLHVTRRTCRQMFQYSYQKSLIMYEKFHQSMRYVKECAKLLFT